MVSSGSGTALAALLSAQERMQLMAEQTEIEIQHDVEATLELFNVHNLAGDIATRNWMALMRRTYAEAARELCLRLPPSEERTMALIKLQEAMFWTSAAAAREHGTPEGYGDIPTGAASGGIVGNTQTQAGDGLR